MDQTPNLTLKGDGFLMLSGYCLYAWKRGEEYLYIGISSRGLARPFSHNIINSVEKVQKDDEILCWSLSNLEESEIQEIEGRLISKYEPKYNSAKVPNYQVPQGSNCLNCGKPFDRRRKWQKFCTSKCRSAFHNSKMPEFCPHCGRPIF